MAIEVENAVIAEAPQRYGADWCAILAGTAIAAAVSLLLLAFGAAIGLSFTGAWDGTSAVWAAVAVGLWLCFVQISGLLGGGYIAGRLRRRSGEGTPHEVDIRDGSHGLVVWAVSTVIVAAGTTLAATLGAMAGAAGGMAAADAPLAYYSDLLLRPVAAAQAQPAGGGEAATPSTEVRSEMARLLMRDATGGLSGTDRSYMAQTVARASGITEEQALTRVEETLTAARAAAEKARKTAVLAAFITAASLLIGALAAWWAAIRGGDHRDRGIDFSRFARWT